MLFFHFNFFVYCTFNKVALEAWLTLDNCYMIGWNQTNHRGDHGLNEHVHSDGDPRGDPNGDHGEWGRCIKLLLQCDGSRILSRNEFQVIRRICYR